MSTILSKVVRSLLTLESGRRCRRCGRSVTERDAFGLSEGVCAPCRVSMPA